MREEAEVLDALWDWATVRLRQGGHPWYAALGHEVRALVRGYGREVAP